MTEKAIQCSKMFDSANEQVLEDVIIFVKDNRITDVQPAANVTALDNYEVIDLTGKFVTPA